MGVCARTPALCARVEPVLWFADQVEEWTLAAQLAVQTARQDPRAQETALELQLERLDNVPGNTTFREVQDALSTLVGRYGDDIARLVGQFGDEGAELLARHQDEAVDVLSRSAPAPAPASWTDVIPKEFLDDVGDAFYGQPIPITLQEDLVVYRYWGGESFEEGN